jgi:intracellular septation protein A
MKDWRAFGVEEWRHVKEGARGLALGSLLPVAIFYAGYRLWSFPAAVVAVLLWASLVFVWHRRRTGHADVFSASAFGFACIQAAVGLATQSPNAYLAVPSVENVALGSVFLGSAFVGRPLLAAYAQRLYPIPPAVRASKPFRRAFLVLSAAWFVGLCARALVRLWLLSALPIEAYLVVNTVAGWPFNVGLVALTVWYPLRELRRAGLVVDVPVGDFEEAVEEAVAGVP